ncbi:TetR/AcrR family transcriptional regulator [Amycolatopsis suaedae]|uniref:TetR/AcrR family transcriptional regulator n=1 Tax=Amycolatopsis suaedae TaxID=2510978 RepID=UPI001F0F5974|nr:TetR/AcrR family transcriptional regulator [Amycolatopsis suaedae]
MTTASARKHAAILDAARELFLRNGYGATSMDDVAARAAVSKQTVYKHFADKEGLFTEIISGDVAQDRAESHALIESMPDSTDLAADLREFARYHLGNVMQPHLVRLRRILIGEADRFPHLARLWYRNGPERSCAMFAEWFTALGKRGLLDVPDPMLAAQNFNWLALSIPLNKAMADTREDLFTPDELNRYADEAVRVFLAAYGARSASSGKAAT